MDLDQLCVDEGVMVVRNPFSNEPMLHEGEPITITLYSAESDVMRRFMQRQTDRMQDEARRGTILSTQEREERDTEALVKATKAWSAMPIGGKNLECTPANATLAYTRLPWLRRQVDQYIVRLKNFAAASVES